MKKKTETYLFEDQTVTAVEVQAIKELAGTLKDMRVESVVPIKVDNNLINIPEEEDTKFFIGVVAYESEAKTQKASVLLNASNFNNAHSIMHTEAKIYASDADITSLVEQPFKNVYLEKDRS